MARSRQLHATLRPDTFAGAIKLRAEEMDVTLAHLSGLCGMQPDSLRARLCKSRGKRALQPWQVTIIAALPRTDRPVFDLDAGTRDVMWRRIRDATGIPNLRFHDSRAEAIWRLSRPGKLDVLELARVIGHRDPRSLMIYYQADADEIADRL